MTIYYLYIKRHNITGLKYLGYTKRKNFHSYTGSGKYWKLHLDKHGKTYTTEILLKTENYDEIKQTGKFFSKLWNVAKSDEWANLKPEEGDGGFDNEYMIKISLEKYGTFHHLQSEVCMDKLRSTNMSRYGTAYSSQNPVVKQKQIATLIERYGVDNPLKNENIKDKVKSTCLSRYGFENPMQNTEISTKVKKSVSQTKASPEWKKSQLTNCEYCRLDISFGNYTKWHGPKCLLNPMVNLEDRKMKQKVLKELTCPHCAKNGKGPNMARYHFNNCKTLSILSCPYPT